MHAINAHRYYFSFPISLTPLYSPNPIRLIRILILRSDMSFSEQAIETSEKLFVEAYWLNPFTMRGIDLN